MNKMIKVDIFRVLGADKTTLIKKLRRSLQGEKIVLIENRFGERGIDRRGFLKDSGIEINEMNSGCICCSLWEISAGL